MPMESANFIANKVGSKHDVKDIGNVLDTLHGVSSVSIYPAHNLISVDYDSAGTSYDAIENRLNKMGFEIAADASVINTR